MIYRILADLTALIHFFFIIFVAAGALLVFWKKWIAFFHIPAAFWGAYIEFTGGLCPLTPLENLLRRKAGAEPYQESFIDHYLLPLIYPSGLTREMQIALGIGVVLLNLSLYGLILHRAFSKGQKE